MAAAAGVIDSAVGGIRSALEEPAHVRAMQRGPVHHLRAHGEVLEDDRESRRVAAVAGGC